MTFARTQARRFSILFFAAILGCIAGCGPAQIPPSDIEQSKSLVKELLEKWKAGVSMESLAQETPPIIVSEDLWRKGAKLDSYSIIEDGKSFGANVRFRISLKCTGKDGKVSERTFNYLVTTTPAITFFREES